MKAYCNIRKKGILFSKKFSQKFIDTLLEKIELREKNTTDYVLWGFPKECPRIWYLVTGDSKKRVVKEIKPTLICKIIAESLKEADDILEKTKREKELLDLEIKSLKKEKSKFNRANNSNFISNEVFG